MRIFILSVLTLVLAVEGINAGSWQNVTQESEPGLAGNEIQFIQSGQEKGELWVGTLTGISRVRGGKFAVLTDAKGKPLDYKTWMVLEFGPDKYWIGHDMGVSMWDGKNEATALNDFRLAMMFKVQEDTVWALAQNRNSEKKVLYIYHAGTWEPIKETASKQVVDLFQDKSGKFWISLDGDGVLEVDPIAGFDKAVHHLRGLNVTAIAEFQAGRIWCGLWSRGIRVWDGVSWREHLSKEKKSAILNMVQDQQGNMWVATNDNGIWRKPYNEDVWTNDLSDKGGITMLASTRDGRVWVSSQAEGGLYYWDKTKWVASLENQLPIRCMLETSGGQLWAGGIMDGLYLNKD
ncbi:MAG: hypothetical protein HQL31_03775 [Planctomycetes bacterium]|nr:hypothetical protein [Planctomycetota bacterium]